MFVMRVMRVMCVIRVMRVMCVMRVMRVTCLMCVMRVMRVMCGPQAVAPSAWLDLPPRYVSVACKPVLFDLASNASDFVSVERKFAAAALPKHSTKPPAKAAAPSANPTRPPARAAADVPNSAPSPSVSAPSVADKASASVEEKAASGWLGGLWGRR